MTKRVWIIAAVTVAIAGIIIVVLARRGRDAPLDAGPTTSTTSSGTAGTGSAHAGTSTDNTTAPSMVTTSSSNETTTSATPTTSTTRSTSVVTTLKPVPGATEHIAASPGGGSGEVALRWQSVPDAIGYRVLRSNTANGDYGIVADINVTTGATTSSPEVINIFSSHHSYVPPDGPLDAPDPSVEFQYIEVSDSPMRCFRVVAYNDAGAGPASTSACGAIP